MKISSLFRDKAYAFPQGGNQEDDCEFAVRVLHKIRPRFKLKHIMLWTVTDDFDVFFLVDHSGDSFTLKISLSDPRQTLKKEVTILRGSKCPVFPQLITYGTTKVGEEVGYLLTKTFGGESLRNVGRSVIVENVNELFDCYFEISATKPVKNTYKKVLNSFKANLNPTEFLTKEAMEAFKEYTDYPLCESLLLKLREEIDTCSKEVEKSLNIKCHASISLDSVFYNGETFNFDTLHTVCMGHPFIDFVDLILDSGIDQDMENQFLRTFCEKGGIPYDKKLYNQFYHLQLRKKLADLVLGYIQEVYLFGSYRFEKILNISDVFSHCYERFCRIQLFAKNREFIMKTICEPIFGVKA